MVELVVKGTIVEETVAAATKSFARKRRRESDGGVNGGENPPLTTKRGKNQSTDADGKIYQPENSKAYLESTQTVTKIDSVPAPPKRRQRAVNLKAAELEPERIGSGGDERQANGSGIGTSVSQRKRKNNKKAGKVDEQVDAEEEREKRPNSSDRKKRKAKEVTGKIPESEEQDTDAEDGNKGLDGDTLKKPKRRRKTKEEKEAEAMPIAVRTIGLRMYVGAHVSAAKGIQNSVTNCLHIGGNAFALFLKSQRKWDNPALADESRDAFRSHCHSHQYDATSHIVPHGSYLVNLAHEDEDRARQSYDTFVDDLHRCERLGIKLYNFHPGASNSSPLPEAIKRIAKQLNLALASTKTVTPLLETMAGSGTVIGSRFSDLRDIISHIEPEFRSRIGVCLDTCHVFAAGYDLRTPESFKKVLQHFDDTVGMGYLKAVHLNDSKAVFSSKRDLHQNIGLGFLGLRAFHNVMNEPRFENLPLILETSCEVPDPDDPTGKKTIDDKRIWAREIKLLESLIGMDADGDDFARLERDLSEKGREEREKMLRAVEAKQAKETRKLEKGQKTLMDMKNTAVGKDKDKGGPKEKDKYEKGKKTKRTKKEKKENGSPESSGDEEPSSDLD